MALPAVSDIDWLAVLVAALASFLLGGLWYGLLFAKPWMALAYPGRSMEDVKREGRDAGPGYALAGVTSLVAAATLAWFLAALDPAADAALGIRVGIYAAVGFVATSFLSNYWFAGRPMRLYAIDAGYQMTALVVIGLVLGAWP